MARLPTPKLVQVDIDPAEDNEERMKIFKCLIRKAIDRRYIAEMKQSKGGTKDE